MGASAGGVGTKNVRKAYSTTNDRTKARMTRFSIRNGNSLCQRIESPAVQGMATEQSPYCSHDATKHTITFDGFVGVLRASWREAAGSRQPRRDNGFVRAYSLQCNASTCGYTHFPFQEE